MTDEIPSIMNHVSIAVSDPAVSFPFYEAVLATIGARRLHEHGDTVAYGKQFPEFWVHGTPFDGGSARPGIGVHFAFFARNQQEVHDFHAAAIAHGATDDGAPGPRPDYGAGYYGCFVRDPDGHKLEATFFDVAKVS
ncbi:MAG: VOC family protein [Proteobacteria bacterium]|nr:VOC family protein [Pseudomonadota bacterium]